MNKSIEINGKYLVEVMYKDDATRKRVDYIAKRIQGSYKPKGHVVVLPENGVRKLLDRVHPEQLKITNLGPAMNIDEFSDYRTDIIELPRGSDEKLLNYFLKSRKIIKDDNFLRSKLGMLEITDSDFTNNPYIRVRYRTSIRNKKMIKKLKDSIDLYRRTMEDR